MPKKVWVVRGYDSNEQLWEERLPYACLSHKEMKELLQRLACQNLNHEEIICASMRRNHADYSSLLRISEDTSGGRCHLTTTSNPYYIAAISGE